MKSFILFCFLLLASGQIFAAEASEKLTKLLDEIWQYELSISPRFATSMGVHDYDDQLADISPQALARQAEVFSTFMQRLNALDVEALTRDEQITLLMQKYRVQNDIDSYRFNAHYVPLTSEYGFHGSLGGLANSTRFKTAEDYQNYLARLSLFPRQFSQHIAYMKKGMEVGMVQPAVVLQGFEDGIKSYFAEPVEQSRFYKPFTEGAILEFEDDVREKLQAKAFKVIQDDVYPSYQSFYTFFTEQYQPNAKQDISALTWPDGEAYYQNRVEYYTTTSMSFDDIHELGLQEVARIRAQMQQIVDELEFEGDINDFIEFLRTDPQFYAKTADELLMFASYVSKQMDAQLPKLFYKLPRTPYGVAPVPDSIAPKYTTGRYVSPRRDDQPGYYWVNTYALDKRPLYAIPALTLHEAVPGHHLQISLSRELDDLPEVRRYTYISAFGEGWGLYSEYLGKEVGIYKTPYEEFGRLSYEMWRAARLVVDTGMHTKGWSRDKAMKFMLENTALSELNVNTEIDRYISWPAQALSYKIGELEIKALRKEAEAALGDKFDLRAFHDALLAYGSVPLSVLRENIGLFISDQ
ncbi:DUF885 domain-containing protein [Aestuariibacter salexigens]|uniref:DUF885 domain-containing protein n=1 Tax=Aestuariibacter salexigens TaxID=226010 RepID=UPI00047D356B|nr:DUF885 domain-containing protein [Aestuariibacter salexigens]